MKTKSYIHVFFVFLLCMLLLSACAGKNNPEGSSAAPSEEILRPDSSVEEASDIAKDVKTSVTINNVKYDGTYSGSLVSDRPEGKGTFSAENFSFSGDFTYAVAMNGTLEGYPLSLEILKETYDGTYTGALTEGKITGEGKFVTDALTYTGHFEDAKPGGNGSVSQIPHIAALNGTEYEGSYSGEVKDFVPSGTGTFVSGDVSYAGSFSEGAVTDGELTKLPITIHFKYTEYKGFYTGPVKGGKLTGTAAFASDTLNYKGLFEDSVPLGTGDVINYTYSLEYMGHKFVGQYSGPLENFKSNSKGTYVSPEDKNKNYLSYKGTFVNSIPDTGTLSTNLYKMIFIINSDEEYERTGTYEGPIEKGVAHGKGVFKARNSADNPYVHEGSFINGRADGTSTVTYTNAFYTFTWNKRYTNGKQHYDKLSDYACMKACMYTKDTNPVVYKKETLEFFFKYDKEFAGLTGSETLKAMEDKNATYSNVYADTDKFIGHIAKFSHYKITRIQGPADVTNGELYEMCITMKSMDNPNDILWINIFGTKAQLESTNLEEGAIYTVWCTPLCVQDPDETNYRYIEANAFDLIKEK